MVCHSRVVHTLISVLCFSTSAQPHSHAGSECQNQSNAAPRNPSSCTDLNVNGTLYSQLESMKPRKFKMVCDKNIQGCVDGKPANPRVAVDLAAVHANGPLECAQACTFWNGAGQFCLGRTCSNGPCDVAYWTTETIDTSANCFLKAIANACSAFQSSDFEDTKDDKGTSVLLLRDPGDSCAHHRRHLHQIINLLSLQQQWLQASRNSFCVCQSGPLRRHCCIPSY